MRSFMLSGLAIVMMAGPGFADGEIDKLLTAADKAKLANFESTKTEALAVARKSGAASDVKWLNAALSGKPMSMSGAFNPLGDWRCRTIKLGGAPELTVYGWFKCRISDDGAGWMLEKLDGSQRTKGRFYTASDTRLTYAGAGYVSGDKPRIYSQAEKENQVAVVERLGEKKLVLQFPEPAYESKFDILLLER
jgi:Domain of unknown function (DUF4893)